jgi:hypothetical protein
MRLCAKSWTTVMRFYSPFDEWEKNAESERGAAKREGVSIIPVFVDPDEFFTFCKRRKSHPTCDRRSIRQ